MEWTFAEKVKADFAIQDILAHGCQAEGNLLVELRQTDRIAIWDARITRYGLLTGSRDAELTIVRVWSGANANVDDPPINWSKTMAHEAIHLLHPEYGNDQTVTAAKNCF